MGAGESGTRAGRSTAVPGHETTDVTRLLARWAGGDHDALGALLPLVYVELRRMAARHLRRERHGHTLVPTALVHEAYLRLVQQHHPTWQNRNQFFGVAGEMMRRILVDYARSRGAAKRGGSATLVSLGDVGRGETAAVIDVLAVDEALTRLAALDADQARLVELRFFAGLTLEDIAPLLGRSERTLKREWRLARAWLFQQLRLKAAT